MHDQTFDLLKASLEDIKSNTSDLKRGLDELRQGQAHIEKLLTRHEERLETHTEKLALANEKVNVLDRKIDDGLTAVRTEIELKVKGVKEDLQRDTKEMSEVFKTYSGFWTATKWILGGIVLIGGSFGAILTVMKFFSS